MLVFLSLWWVFFHFVRTVTEETAQPAAPLTAIHPFYKNVLSRWFIFCLYRLALRPDVPGCPWNFSSVLFCLTAYEAAEPEAGPKSRRLKNHMFKSVEVSRFSPHSQICRFCRRWLPEPEFTTSSTSSASPSSRTRGARRWPDCAAAGSSTPFTRFPSEESSSDEATLWKHPYGTVLM